MPATKTNPACTIHRDGMSMVGLKSGHIYAKISPKKKKRKKKKENKVNPRDLAGNAEEEAEETKDEMDRMIR